MKSNRDIGASGSRRGRGRLRLYGIVLLHGGGRDRLLLCEMVLSEGTHDRLRLCVKSLPERTMVGGMTVAKGEEVGVRGGTAVNETLGIGTMIHAKDVVILEIGGGATLSISASCHSSTK